jgi:acetyl esterase
MTKAIDPAIVALADAAAAPGAPPLHEITPAEARERVRLGNALCAAGPVLRRVQDVAIPVGDAAIGARLYRPVGPAPDRTLVYLHGGGWVTGDLDHADDLCRFLARDAGCTVVSVDYSLAPEHPYPQPLTDALAALDWAAKTVATSGPLAVGGDSAGGNLAAACAIHARDNDGPELAFQLLVYPVLDHDFERPSYLDQADGFPIGARSMRWFWDHYVPDITLRDDPLVAPLRSRDLDGLPPAHIVVAGHDPLHDEAVAYAERLAQACAEVTVRDHPTLVHGFCRLTAAVPAARAAVAELTDAVRLLFERHQSRPA